MEEGAGSETTRTEREKLGSRQKRAGRGGSSGPSGRQTWISTDLMHKCACPQSELDLNYYHKKSPLTI